MGQEEAAVDDTTDSLEETGTLLILTLKRHQDGVWIRRLVRELQKVPRGGERVAVQVHCLEEWLGEGLTVSKKIFDGVIGIINRISDAAPPHLFKATTAVLGAAQCVGIPLFNGPVSYSMCANKWCQHVIFHKARLKTPHTEVFFNSSDIPSTAHLDMTQNTENREAVVGAWEASGVGDDECHEMKGEFLIKPNAGGFGAGIVKVSSIPKDLPIYEDGLTLVQKYVRPKHRKLYRVWFLNAKVQCAIERTLPDDDGATEFTGACAGGTCSLSRPILEAYDTPKEVRHEIEQQLLPHLVDADCGSVEYLYSSDGAGEERLYFDLNLLSTLPISVLDPSHVWGSDYDPWQQLAEAIWDKLVP